MSTARLPPAARVFIAGASAMVGTAIVRQLMARGFSNLVSDRDDLDLGDATAVDGFFATFRPEYVVVVAGREAGIAGNQRYPADLMLDNLRVAANVIPAAWRYGTTKLLYLASSCTYPKSAPQPLRADTLWTGPLEPTSSAYAAAKLAGMRLCEAYRQQYGARFVTAIKADVFGPRDDFDTGNSHVVAALMRRMHEAKLTGLSAVEIWGTGSPRREFIYVDDLAEASLFLMDVYDDATPINIGTGETTSIRTLAEMLREIVGYDGELRFDTSRPDGMPLKGLDSTPLRTLGWKPSWTLRSALATTYEWFREQPDAQEFAREGGPRR